MKRLLLILMLLSACTTVSYEEHTNAGSKYVLKNGMTVILKENPDTSMTAADLFVKRSIAEDGELHGLGQFTNRLLLTGTKSRTREQIPAEIENAGGTIAAKTLAEYSELAVSVPSDKLSVALDIISDVVRNPTFPQEELEKERINVLGELESKLDQPDYVVEEVFLQTIYEGHPYQHPIDGRVDTIQRITREDVMKHYKDWYAPNNIILVITGNINREKTVKAVDALFGSMKASETREFIPTIQPRTQAKTNTQQLDTESYYIQQGYILPPAPENNDFVTMRVLNAVLGSGSGSRLFYNLRDKQALAYTVYSIVPSTRTNGFLKVSMITGPDTLNQSLAGINEQLSLLKNEQVPEEELIHARQKLRGFFFLDHQKTTDQANYLGIYEASGLGYQFDTQYPELIGKVTSEEIHAAANEYIREPSTAIVGPFKE